MVAVERRQRPATSPPSGLAAEPPVERCGRGLTVCPPVGNPSSQDAAPVIGCPLPASHNSPHAAGERELVEDGGAFVEPRLTEADRPGLVAFYAPTRGSPALAPTAT